MSWAAEIQRGMRDVASAVRQAARAIDRFASAYEENTRMTQQKPPTMVDGQAAPLKKFEEKVAEKEIGDFSISEGPTLPDDTVPGLQDDDE